ncbi:MAG: hypothetical protein JWO77_774 [Ilumatobacteraceae bacterium]|nr:hypothetical protein [Ilumatobacteraceae bacterium]
MMKSRGLAVIGAFVLVALAIVIRGRLAKDDPGSDGPKRRDGSDRPVVACAPDLAAVCDALAADGKIAKDPPDLDLPGAAAPDDAIDGWITWSPAPQIANFVADPSVTRRVWEQEVEALGGARTVVLVDGTSVDALSASCRSKPTWRCLAAADSGLAIGVGDPATAEGIARLAPLAEAFADDRDIDTIDSAGIEDLLAGPTVAQTDADEMATQLTTSPGGVSVVVGPMGLLTRFTSTAQGKQRRLTVLEPSPKATLSVVVAGRTGHDLALTCDDLPADAEDAVTAVGVSPCSGSTDDGLAGFLFQVQKKVG